MFVTRSLNVTPKTTEHNLIVRSGKPEAELINTKLTTDRHKASRGLSATAELLVWYCHNDDKRRHGHKRPKTNTS